MPNTQRLIALPFVEEFLEVCLTNVRELSRETDNGSIRAETLNDLCQMLIAHDLELEVREIFRAWLDGFDETYSSQESAK